MKIEQTPHIESVIAQMRTVSAAASSPSGLAGVPAAIGGFAAELERTLARVSSLQNQAVRQGRSFELGDRNVSLSDVMIDMQKAGLAFQAAVQVRNRLVTAYQEIASMPV